MATPCIAATTQGDRLEFDRLGALLLTETRHPPNLALEKHSHAYACITYVLEGGYEETCAGKVWDCQPTAVLLKPVGEPHRNRYGHAGSHSLVVSLMPEYLGHLDLADNNIDGPKLLRTGDAIMAAARLYREFRLRDSTSGLVIDGLVREIIGWAQRDSTRNLPESAQRGHPPLWLLRTRDRLHDNFRSPLSISALAASAEVHPDHLSRCFRHYFGQLIGDYVRGLRVEWCASQLVGTDRTLADIAIEAGFADQSHFSRVFKKNLGLSPGLFRSIGLRRQNH